MQRRGANKRCSRDVQNEKCKGEVQEIGAAERCIWQWQTVCVKINKKGGAARVVPIFLIWTSKLSKLRPKTCQDKPKRPRRWSQDGQVGANMEPRWHQDGQRCAKIGLREHQDGAKMAKLEPIWSQNGGKIAPRGPERLPKGSQNHWKSLLGAIRAPQEKQKVKMQ